MPLLIYTEQQAGVQQKSKEQTGVGVGCDVFYMLVLLNRPVVGCTHNITHTHNNTDSRFGTLTYLQFCHRRVTILSPDYAFVAFTLTARLNRGATGPHQETKMFTVNLCRGVIKFLSSSDLE